MFLNIKAYFRSLFYHLALILSISSCGMAYAQSIEHSAEFKNRVIDLIAHNAPHYPMQVNIVLLNTSVAPLAMQEKSLLSGHFSIYRNNPDIEVVSDINFELNTESSNNSFTLLPGIKQNISATIMIRTATWAMNPGDYMLKLTLNIGTEHPSLLINLPFTVIRSVLPI